jgi:microsomal epoxide hydrolase
VPLLLVHGWPGAFTEFLDLYEPLAAPPANEPAFHVITPSLPGYGYSTTKPGVSPQRIAAIFAVLMERLGYERYIVQGGDWGSLVGTEIARQFPERVIGLHLNLVNGSPPPDRDSIALTPEEQSWIAHHGEWVGLPHVALNSQKPASFAHALNDSPAGLAAWIGDKIHDWMDREGAPLSFDRMIGIIAIYWFTQTAGSSARLYYEMMHDPPAERFVTAPTAGAILPKEIVKIPRAWAERHYNIVQWTVFDRGGHFAAMEVPELLLADLRRFATLLSAP